MRRTDAPDRDLAVCETAGPMGDLEEVWPTVIRPLAEAFGGPTLLVGDHQRALLNLLALGAEPVHVVACDLSDEAVTALYGDRIVMHAQLDELPRVNLAVLGDGRRPFAALNASVVVAAAAEDDETPAGWVSVDCAEPDTVSVFAREAALAGVRRALQPVVDTRADPVRRRVADLERRLTEATVRMERAERTADVTRDLLSALRAGQLAEQEECRRLVERIAELKALQAATAVDLRAIASSVSWRAGHAVVRPMAILLRREVHDPVRTAINRIERALGGGRGRR